MTAGRDFWSRRRAAVEAEDRAQQAAVAAEQTAQEQAALDDKSDAEILAELDLPDPDHLQPGDDVSGFMARAVPDRLRRRALRRLWRLNPVLANVDGLVDYGEDFTDASRVVENLQTAYQVGKGMLAHVEEMARQAEVKAQDPDPDTPETRTTQAALPVATSPSDAPEAAPAADTGEEASAPAGSEEPVAQPAAQPAVPAPRRMQFVFEG